jgi:hypothetical protein
MNFFILTETNLPQMLYLVARRKPVCIVQTRSLLRGANTAHLDKIVFVLRRQNRLSTLWDDRHEWISWDNGGDFIRGTDAYAELEPFLEETLSFETTEQSIGAYAIGFKNAMSNVAFQRYYAAYLVNDVLSQAEPGQAVVFGLDWFDIRLQNVWFGREESSTLRETNFLNGAFNIGLTAIAVFKYWAFLIRKTHLRRVEPEDIFLACDDADAFIENYLREEVIDAPGPALIVFRTETQKATPSEKTLRCRHTTSFDGAFTIVEALQTGWEVTLDSLRLFRTNRHLPINFFRAAIALPYWRVVYRGLFNRYRCQFFWARDEYNAQHSMRSQELRRIGGTALALMHGIPGIITYSHQLRHLDFDIYYVYGRPLIKAVFADKWPAAMDIKAIGMHAMTRKELETFPQDRPNDIVCFVSPCFQEYDIMKVICEVARAFPERTVYVNTKKASYENQALDWLIKNSPDNVSFTREHSYALLRRCSYVIGEGTTLIAESAALGLTVFSLDVTPRLKFLLYRQFPDVVVKDAGEIIRRINQSEAGVWRQSRERLTELINMSGRIGWDVIRSDLGLSPKRTTPVAHLMVPNQEKDSIREKKGGTE